MKMIPSIFKNKQSVKQLWQYPSCKHPKTLSFRVYGVGCDDDLIPPTIPDEDDLSYNSTAAPSLETVISTVRMSSSRRLFFEPEETSSMVNVKYSKNGKSSNNSFLPCVAMAVESDDPYLDFKKSMEEMVESDEGFLKDWDYLEELLLCYLKMNGKINHRFIVGAFVDLLVGSAEVDSRKNKKTTMMVSGSDSATATTYSSASSSFSSPSSSIVVGD